MEGRCAVETWAQFGTVPCRARVTDGELLFICDGSDEVNIFHIEEKRIMVSGFNILTMISVVYFIIYYLLLWNSLPRHSLFSKHY